MPAKSAELDHVVAPLIQFVDSLEKLEGECKEPAADDRGARSSLFRSIAGRRLSSVQEFKEFVTTQIVGMFRLLLHGEAEEEADWKSATITVDHLRRADADMEASTFDDVDLLEMVRTFDFDGNGQISLSAFEQIVLMVPARGLG